MTDHCATEKHLRYGEANEISLVLQLHKIAQIAFCCIAVR